MAYLGAEPVPGQNREVDDISSGFNGSTTAFTLQVESQNVSPESANNILVSIAGVLKNPNTDYTINASTITFTSAPTSGQAFFGLILGAGINTSTVADGSITQAKLADQSITNAKLNNSAAIAGTKISPDFGSQTIVTTGSASVSGDLDVAADIRHIGDTNTKIAFGTDTIDLRTGGASRLQCTDSGVDVTGNITATGGEGASAVINLIADEGDDNGDGWKIQSEQDENDLTFKSNISGSYVDKLKLKSNGQLEVQGNLSVSGTITPTGNVVIPDTIVHDGDSNTKIRFPAADTFAVETAGNERFRINVDGRVLLGTTAAPSLSGRLNLFGTDDSGSAASLRRGSANADGPQLHFVKSRNTTDGSHTLVQNDDVLGRINFAGNDGQGPEFGARISAEVDHDAGGNDMPTRLVFSVTPNGSDTLAEIVKIREDGRIDLGVSGPASRIDAKSTSGVLKVEADPGNNFGSSEIEFFVDNSEIMNIKAGTNPYVGVGRSGAQGTEKFGVEANGTNVCFFGSQSSGTFVTLTLLNKRATGSTEGEQISFLDTNGTQRGKITNGTSSTSYHTSSDYRLKENEVLISDGIERIKQLKPYKFNWKNKPDITVDGFFAHEVENIVVDCVDGTKDRVVTEEDHNKGDYLDKEINTEIHQMMDHSKLVPLLTAALKDAITKIETLETKVAALEAA